MSDKQKRAYIRQKGGAVTWNMGKLSNKDVWHVRFDDGEHLVLRGNRPTGATEIDGPGSAYKTTTRLGKKRSFTPFTQQHGAVRATLSPSARPKGAEIRFNSVKRGGQYYTNLGGSVGISRRPLGKRRR